VKEKSVTWRKLDDLHLWGDNPNSGDLGTILQSVNRFGYNESIIVWNDRVQGGNHRVMALHQLWQGGWRPSERDRAVRMNGDGLEVATWDVSHLESEQEANAFGIALNRTTRLGMDDPAKLAALLQDIAAVDESAFVASGYDGDDLDELLRGLSPPDLERLENEYGEPGDRDFWPIIRVQVSPETFLRYNKILGGYPGEDETVKFSELVEDAVIFRGYQNS
jgi:hypothetical protein